MELVVDAREHELIERLREKESERRMVVEGLTIGDIMVRGEDGRPILLVERKTVADLCASVRDGRYRDQRRRWGEFQMDYPEARVALWLEGDLMACPDRGLLLNMLMRLQSIHHVLVHQVRSMEMLIASLDLVLEKFEKEPGHLLRSSDSNPGGGASGCLKKYKKTCAEDWDAETMWRGLLTMIPGVSTTVADAIRERYPTMHDLLREATFADLAAIRLASGRRIGDRLARRILIGFLEKKKSGDNEEERIRKNFDE